MKKCTGRSRILAQDKVIRGNGWYGRQDEKTIQENVYNWSSPEAKFLV